MIIDNILGTDMSKHGAIIKDIEAIMVLPAEE
jgi:hypothetical protein